MNVSRRFVFAVPLLVAGLVLIALAVMQLTIMTSNVLDSGGAAAGRMAIRAVTYALPGLLAAAVAIVAIKRR